MKTDLPSTFPNTSETEIIHRVLEGEKNLFGLLVSKYNPQLHRIGNSIVHDEQETEEIIQISFIHAYEHLASFENNSTFGTWITRILINECFLFLRKKKRLAYLDQHANYPTAGVVNSKTPAMQMQQEQLKSLLETAIRNLPEKYRTVFEMREIDGRSVAETQRMLNLSESNVKIRLNRAKSMLKEALFSKLGRELAHFHLNSALSGTKTIVLEVI